MYFHSNAVLVLYNTTNQRFLSVLFLKHKLKYNNFINKLEFLFKEKFDFLLLKWL